MYTTGILDAFLENNIFINNIYGVSAGALNAMSYLSKQKGRSYRVNKEYIFKNCVDYKRVLQGKAILDLDYLFNEVNKKLDIFDVSMFEKNIGEYIVNAVDVKTGNTIYKSIKNYGDYPYIKASAALPLFAKSVEIDGLKLIDGGVGDPIPVMKAINDGYDKIVVVLTRHKEYEAKPYKLMNLYKIKYKKYPKLIETLKNRHNKYNTTRDLIEQLEKEGKVFSIYPSEELVISHLERDMDTIDSVYEIGYQDGLKIVNQVKRYIGGRTNEQKRK